MNAASQASSGYDLQDLYPGSLREVMARHRPSQAAVRSHARTPAIDTQEDPDGTRHHVRLDAPPGRARVKVAWHTELHINSELHVIAAHTNVRNAFAADAKEGSHPDAFTGRPGANPGQAAIALS